MDSGRQRLARASGDSFAEKYQTYIAIMVQNVPAPYGVEENFGGYFHDHDDPALAEDLQNQESIYLSFQGNVHGGSSRLNNGHDRNMVEGYSSRMARVEQQLALDEALARELQESENQLADTSFGEVTRIEANITPAQSFTASAERSSASTSSQTSDIPCAISAAVSVHHKRLHSPCLIARRLICSVYRTVFASFDQLGCSS
ncbi:Zinc finger, C3HC4 type (RING finger) [Musa troglodytarum]|uniref:Zinc finger, C3HC4 type (RING finger) n=1 Tax=Musa troglodytarum TaxID=320322 RepID=A0A9E7FBD7_9LILI|nr:Zinc finger, C3HC4 type (RING finger) [Musa troglodytarum]